MEENTRSLSKEECRQETKKYAEIAREYFKHKKVYRYRMKKISEMSDEEVIQKCHWWQEENNMVRDYWSFAEKRL